MDPVTADDGGQGGRRDGAGRPDGATTAPVGLRLRLLTARTVRTEAQARLAALEAGEREGRLVDRDRACADARRRGMAFRDGVLALPGRVATKIAAATTAAEVERILRDALVAEVNRHVPPDA